MNPTQSINERDFQLLQMTSALKIINQIPMNMRDNDLKNLGDIIEKIIAKPDLNPQECQTILKNLSQYTQNNFLQIHTQNQFKPNNHYTDMSRIELTEDQVDYQNFVIPPYGKARFSTKERHEKLEQIATISTFDKKKNSTRLLGCFKSYCR